ncbi:hypothetical protein MNBD_PLANCTO02-222 [hydrothermal vent metagenome]|uniref:AAA+ ATPase domain-containing protein n=1 Tax=hydrothermal vent metagenome TaxID=652676 RepID=A0A3B1DP95_9ZZZZ
MDIKQFITPYSPWFNSEEKERWESSIPSFRRPVFEQLMDDLDSIEQMLSVTGPRRVGKSTLLHQMIQHLINEKNVPVENILYYSFDDPALFQKNCSGEQLIELLFESAKKREGTVYLFLDEIQTLERWELYLKKYYDLKFPCRVVVSGSASSPFFKKSRESLLGRIKDYHVLPFSFCEYLLFELTQEKRTDLIQEVHSIRSAGEQLKGMLIRSPSHLETEYTRIPELSLELWDYSSRVMETYLVDGGFPEVWKMPTQEKKIEYLYDNQVKKVIYEDLVVATELRKPEQLKRFYISLLGHPGVEVNFTKSSNETEVNRQQIEKYLPLLEMTDLIAHASKFRKSATRVRKGNRKYYLIDLALRNTVLRIGKELLEDSTTMGLYAENLVFNALRKWKGMIQLDYYRENNQEVDFIVQVTPSKYIPIEVKYRNQWSRSDLKGIDYFRNISAN